MSLSMFVVVVHSYDLLCVVVMVIKEILRCKWLLRCNGLYLQLLWEFFEWLSNCCLHSYFYCSNKSFHFWDMFVTSQNTNHNSCEFHCLYYGFELPTAKYVSYIETSAVVSMICLKDVTMVVIFSYFIFSGVLKCIALDVVIIKGILLMYMISSIRVMLPCHSNMSCGSLLCVLSITFDGFFMSFFLLRIINSGLGCLPLVLCPPW